MNNATAAEIRIAHSTKLAKLAHEKAGFVAILRSAKANGTSYHLIDFAPLSYEFADSGEMPI